ncbi:MAG: PhzF family phenazine biosynthesis protein [Clostridiales bacterium]|jgi:PhzF family phenazine biosynthesis protein|nr:PhzF family phenazine biosynthesis protein [Clostridiales bacterium]
MKYYVADAFVDGPFTGNPAGVCIMDSYPDDAVLQNIACENNLSETAFLVKTGDAAYNLRWFTTVSEVDLCGHATLASSFVIMNYLEPEAQALTFASQSGILRCKRSGELYALDFPSRMPVPAEITPIMEEAVGAKVLEAHKSRDLVLLLDSEETVRNLNPSMELLLQIKGFLGVCVTAKGDTADFVSRFFTPAEGIPEDPVTGSAHSNLIPFWAKRLNKAEMTARQLSRRGGWLYVKDMGERVEIEGRARLYLSGEIFY